MALIKNLITPKPIMSIKVKTSPILSNTKLTRNTTLKSFLADFLDIITFDAVVADVNLAEDGDWFRLAHHHHSDFVGVAIGFFGY